MLPTADRKVAIDTSTNIERVVVASIDHHSIEKIESLLTEMLTVCQPRVDRDVDRGSIEVSIASVDRHLIAIVNSAHEISPLVRKP